MDNKKTLQDIERMEGSLASFFTPEKLKNDFWEGEERGIFPVHNSTFTGTSELELTRDDEFAVMSFKMVFHYNGFSWVQIEIAVGGLDDSSGYPVAGKCYLEMEYGQALALKDCILRDTY